MKRCMTAISVVLAFPLMAWGTDWDTAYTPTKKEWIETVVHSDIVKVTDLWKTRIAVNVVARKADEVVMVVFTAANGQESMSDAKCSSYVQTISSIVQSSVARFSWAKNARIEVKCVQ